MRALHFRILLRTFVAGLAAVWLFNGFNIAWRDMPVELPEAKSADVLAVFPALSGRIWYTGCCSYPHGDFGTPASMLGSRDLRRYEDGGEHSDCNWIMPGTERDCEESLGKARQFIWSHWRDKIRGYLRITFHGLDSYTEVHLFIEPDRRGNWRVVEYYDRGCDAYDARFERTTDIRNVVLKRATKADHDFPRRSLFLKMTDEDGDDRSF